MAVREAEREVRVTVHAPAHLTLTEIAEMIWDKLDHPDSVLTVCAIAVSTALPCSELVEHEQEFLPGHPLPYLLAAVHGLGRPRPARQEEKALIDSCIGGDPGPATGLAFLDYDQGRLVGRSLVTAEGASAPIVLQAMLHTYYSGKPYPMGRRVASLEKFVTGASAGSRGRAADVTRQLVYELAEVLEMFGYAVKIRSAADVKPWANDKRLIAAGVGTKAQVERTDFRHMMDGARHCLFGARDAGIIQDPLLLKRVG
jgi:hypothetical protein